MNNKKKSNSLPNPVIVIPGVTATYLHDRYPLPPETLWSVMTKDFRGIKLHPDDISYEVQQPSLVRAGQIYEVAYEELVEELRYELSPSSQKQVPVFPFGYDWRHPLDRTEVELDSFIDEVIDRTKLLQHYHREKYGDNPKVNLIGHSMGGLIAAGYLERFGGKKVGKVVSLASPFRGSFEAIVKMAAGTGDMGGPSPKPREREAARLTPSLYHLLPSFDTGIQFDDNSPLPGDTFDKGLWQRSIINTVVDYVRDHGLKPSEKSPRDRGIEVFENLLARAKEHRDRLDGLNLASKDFSQADWLCVVGVGTDTRVQMKVRNTKSGPQFMLTSRDRMNGWKSEDEAARRQTGDGTVHFEGALPKFLPYESLVCVSPDDYGSWEWKDRGLTMLSSFHGILPNMNMLQRLIARYFKDAPDTKKNTWGRPPPGVTDENWKPPLKLKLKTTKLT